MRLDPKQKLEPRAENEPKFNPNNKTDRKIVTVVIISVSVGIVLLVGLFLIYYLLFKGQA